MAIAGIIFDKDGTLFDFQATWAPGARRLVEELAGGDQSLAARLAAALGYNQAAERMAADSVMVAETPETVADALMAVMPAGADRRHLIGRLDAIGAETPQVPAVPLLPLLERLRGRGLRLACVTNDTEAVARAHLREAGIETRFEAVVGYDSGHGTKPDPDPLLAIAGLIGLVPEEMLMVGDSAHDMRAGKAAGMGCVAVLTGTADREMLEPLADAVLDDIGDLSDWIAARDR